MKIIQAVILLSFLFFVPQPGNAQQLKEDEVVVIEGEKYILHQVRTGETIFSISRDFKIDRTILLKNNPKAEEGINIGEILKIPYSEGLITVQNTITKKGNPTRFDSHTIESRNETPYFIARKYGVTVEEIYAFNTGITKYEKGVKVRIPRWDRAAQTTENKTNVTEKTTPVLQEHKIGSGETLWGIARQYNVSEADLKALNPFLENGFPAGATIKIPVKNGATTSSTIVIAEPKNTAQNNSTTIAKPETVSGECKPQTRDEYSKTTYNVALFLPLFLEDNYSINNRVIMDDETSSDEFSAEIADTDTVIEEVKTEEMFIGFYRDTENYLQFYEGVLLAIDSLQKLGMNIQLDVFDSRQSADAVRKSIQSEKFLKTDLIIGPVFPNLQKDVSSVAAKNRIPMISPLSAQSDDVNSNPYYFQINPDRDNLYRKTAELVARDFSGSNVIIFKTSNYSNSPEGRLAELIREKLNSQGNNGRANGARVSVYDFQMNGIRGLRTMLSNERENVIFIPSTNEGELSVGLSNLNTLASDYPITLIGTSRYPQYESIQIEYFHNLKLTYVSPYWTDYEKPSTVRFIEKFKTNFHTEPGNYGFQGYDVTFYFLNALKNYGKDFRTCLPNLKTDLIQGNYRFEKVSQLGGYMNQGVSVITYERDYDVVGKRVNF